MTNTPKGEYEQIQFDGRTVCVLSPEDVEALELGIQKQAEEIERLRMQLAACGVGALSNTISVIASNRIASDHPYYSASLSDVYQAVDREIALREEIEKLKAEVETVKANDRFRTELSVNNRIITKRRLFEVMQKECPEDGEEVDKISEDTLIEAIESYIWDMRVELITKNDALQTRFDGLLEKMEGQIKKYYSLEELNLFIENIQSIIKQARGE